MDPGRMVLTRGLVTHKMARAPRSRQKGPPPPSKKEGNPEALVRGQDHLGQRGMQKTGEPQLPCKTAKMWGEEKEGGGGSWMQQTNTHRKWAGHKWEAGTCSTSRHSGPKETSEGRKLEEKGRGAFEKHK